MRRPVQAKGCARAAKHTGPAASAVLLDRRGAAWRVLIGVGAMVLTPRLPAQTARKSENGRALRAVESMRVPALGLSVPREIDPTPWETELQPAGGPGALASFTLISPAKVYPATVIVVQSLRDERVQPNELRDFAQGLFDELAPRMGASGITPVLEQARWGVLAGWQSRWRAQQDGEQVDVQTFCGQKPGRWPVLLQAQTAPGKLPHASEFIRRCWSSVDYLS